MVGDFDVFLSHNSQDKPIVEAIAAQLKARGIRVWLDKAELRPGLPWQDGLEKGVEASRSVAVFIGQAGLGAWEEPEMRAFVDRSRREQIPVIPVLLPDCPDSPRWSTFLRAFTWVNLREGVTDEGLARLIWGITGQRPDEATSQNPEPVAAREGPISKSAASRVFRNLFPRLTNSAKSSPRTILVLWVGALAVAIALALLGSIKPDLYEVRVQTLDPEGRPVGGATVRTSTGNESHFLQDGWWEIQIPRAKVPRDGKLWVWAEHEDWESNRTELILGKDANVRAEVRLKQPQTWIRGRVVDENGNALPGAHISCEDGLPGSASSGPDGRFALQLPLARERRVGLRVEFEGWRPDTTYCYAGRDGCHVVLVKL